MRTASRLMSLVVCLPLMAASPIIGVWHMRPGADGMDQVMRVEETAQGVRFTCDIEIKAGGNKLSYYFVTKMDGAPVDAVSSGKPFSKMTAKRVSPYEYEFTANDKVTTQHYKSVISKDGKLLTTDGAIVANGSSIPVHQVFDKVK